MAMDTVLSGSDKPETKDSMSIKILSKISKISKHKANFLLTWESVLRNKSKLNITI